MGPPTPRPRKKVRLQWNLMKFVKNRSKYTVRGRFLGSRGRRRPFQAETGKNISISPPGSGPMYAIVYPDSYCGNVSNPEKTVKGPSSTAAVCHHLWWHTPATRATTMRLRGLRCLCQREAASIGFSGRGTRTRLRWWWCTSNDDVINDFTSYVINDLLCADVIMMCKTAELMTRQKYRASSIASGLAKASLPLLRHSRCSSVTGSRQHLVQAPVKFPCKL